MALTLVIRASKLGDLPAVSQPIPLDRVIDLISAAVYFRCALPPDADATETELGVTGTPEPISSSQRDYDVYLRLEIEDGGDLMDATSPFALRNRLRDHQPGTIQLKHRARLQCPPRSLHDFHSI